MWENFESRLGVTGFKFWTCDAGSVILNVVATNLLKKPFKALERISPSSKWHKYGKKDMSSVSYQNEKLIYREFRDILLAVFFNRVWLTGYTILTLCIYE